MHKEQEKKPPQKADDDAAHDNDNQDALSGDYDPMDLTSPEWQEKFAVLRRKYRNG